MSDLGFYGQQYLAHLLVGSSRTRTEYKRDLERFLAWAADQGLGSPREVTQAHLEQFLSSLRGLDGQPLAIRTKNRILSVVKGFFKFLVKARVIGTLDNPAEGIRALRLPNRRPTYLELDEGAAILLTVMNRETKTEFQRVQRARDTALLALLLGTGLRLTELCNLNVEDWEQVPLSGHLTVIGKGNKERVVPPSQEAIHWVQEYLKVRPEIPRDAQGNPLFVSRKNRRLGTRQVEILVKNWAREAGIQKKITPHRLRATYVTQMLLEGANPRHVQELVGHKSLDTTMIYAGVDARHLKETVKKHQTRYLS